MTDAEDPETGRSGEDSVATNAIPGGERIRTTTPAGVLAAIPHLLGFHPSNSLVVIGLQSPSAKVTVTMRYDLPDPPDSGRAAQIARHAAGVLAVGNAEQAVVVGYGPDRLVAPIIRELQAQKAPEVPLTEILRVADGRYWSYLSTCWPAEGTPFDLAAELAAAMLGVKGPVLGSRDELVAAVATVRGKPGDAMRRATARAEQRAAALLARHASAGQGISVRSQIALAGLDRSYGC